MLEESLRTTSLQIMNRCGDSTQPRRSVTPSVNGRDLTLPTRTQIS